MKNKQRRVNAVLKQLYDMHEQLFGQKYTIGLTLDENSQFNQIIQEFREVIFIVRNTQQERQKLQNKKNFQNTPQRVKINHQIREDIVRAQQILKQAVKRHKNGNKQKSVSQHRNKLIKNCYQLLSDAKQNQRGGIYLPPPIPTLEDIKRNLIGKQYGHQENEQIDFQQEQAIDKFNREDVQIDKGIDQIIEVDKNVRDKMKNANQVIQLTHQKIIQQKKQADDLIIRVNKANKDLQQILKTYRRPSKLCLDITLILLLLALIGVIIALVKG